MMSPKTVITQKVCSRCKQPRPLAAFDRDSSKSDGLRPDCKVCRKKSVNRNDDATESSAETSKPSRDNDKTFVTNDGNDKTRDKKTSICHVETRDNGYTHNDRTEPDNVTISDNHHDKSTKNSCHVTNAKTTMTNDGRPRLMTLRDLKRRSLCLLVYLFLSMSVMTSSLNSSFALFDSARAVSRDLSPVKTSIVVFVISMVFTIGVVLIAYAGFTARSLILIICFLILESLTLAVNWHGVHERLFIAKRASNQAAITVLQKEIDELQSFLDRYPPTDRQGRPVSWKASLSEELVESRQRIRYLQQEISRLQVTQPEVDGFDWLVLLAWLFIPEAGIFSFPFLVRFYQSDRRDSHGKLQKLRAVAPLA
jgi:hypothetical protein